MTEDDFNEFLGNVDRSHGASLCWRWSGDTHPDGYGLFKGNLAHRISFEEKNGPIPEGYVVRHSCDNPPCCNPAHLILGSHAENREDCVAKSRHARGQKHGKSKLTHTQVRFIRTHHKGWTHKAIAEKYGVSRATITKILNRQTYVDVAP